MNFSKFIILLIISFCLLKPFISFSQNRKLDSSFIVLKTLKADTNRVILLNKICGELNNLKMYNKTIDYEKENLPLAEKLQYKKGIANCYNLLGFALYKTDKYDEALIKLQTAFQLYELLGNKLNAAGMLGNMGNLYYSQDLFPKSLECFLKALKIYEEIGRKKEMAGYSGNIGAIYNSIGNNNKAIEFYDKALKINEEIGSKQGIAINLVCLGNAYLDLKNYKSSEEYFEKALVYNQDLGEKKYIANNLSNIGNIKSHLGNDVKALEYYNKALLIYEKIDEKRSTGDVYSHMGYSYLHLRDYINAEKYLLKALEIANVVNALKLKKIVYSTLSKLYELTGEYRKSLDYFKEEVKLKDSLFGIANTKEIIQKQLQFDFEKKEALTKAEFIKEQSLNLVEIEKRKQVNAQLEKDNALNQLSLTESNLKLKEKEVETESQKKQVELLNKDKLLQEAEAQKRAKELEQQKQLRNLFIGGALLLLCFAVYILFNLSKSKKTNRIIEKQKLEVEHQKHIVEEKQKEIVDSINYAQRIQYALLANKKLLDSNLSNYFLYFQPKDVVSGDFYWASKITTTHGRDCFALVTADSTGHGVPGAIMSMLNIACLNESIKADQLTEPADILNAVRNKIINHLMHDGSTDGGKDGMDCSLICFDFKNHKLTYAASNNPVWIIRKNTLITLAADKMPIGRHDKDNIPFKQTEVELQKGDMVYAFTDGFADQFGGPKGKKYKYKQLEELLLSVNEQPMVTQHDILRQSLNNWKGDLEQVDDICVIGVRI